MNMHQVPVFLGYKLFGNLTCVFNYNRQKGLLMLEFGKSGIVFRRVDINGMMEAVAQRFYVCFDESDARDIINYEISCL
jgi:hypothetical protein